MRLLAYLYRRGRLIFVAAALLGVAAGLMGSALVAVIDSAVQGATFGVRTMLLFAALCVASVAARAVSSTLLIRSMQHAMCDLRLSLARQIIAAPFFQVEDLGQPRLYALVTDDINSIVRALTPLVELLPQLSIVVGCFAYMAWVSPALFGMTLVVAALGTGAFLAADRRAARRLARARENVDALNHHLRGLTEGIKELKHNARRRRTFLEEDLGPTAHDLRRDAIGADVSYALGTNLGQILFLAALFFFVFIAPRYLGVAHAVAAAFTVATLFVLRPIEFLTLVFPTLARAGVALRKVDALGFSLVDSIRAPEESRARIAAVELRGARYAYTRKPDLPSFEIGPIDLTLSPGEIVFVIGGNGAGKTTLMKLASGLYAPTYGEVRVDGVAVSSTTAETYRQLFSVIYSDSYPFDSLCDAEGREDEVASLLARLHLDRKVTVKGGRLSTTDLSRGQRKRLLMLNALLEDRPVYVFDEWAADQDPIFRKIFYEEILPSLRVKKKAVLVVSHDDRYFGVADRLLKLTDGSLVPQEVPRSGRVAARGTEAPARAREEGMVVSDVG